jgi:YjbR
MTPDQFRRIALGMSGAIEASHMNHPDFRVNGRIFATIAPDHRRGMVSLTPEQQAGFLRDHPEMFEPAAGAWGRGGATMVRFDAADEETVGEAMTLAWQRAMATPAPKKRAAARKSTVAKGKTASTSAKPQKRRASPRSAPSPSRSGPRGRRRR